CVESERHVPLEYKGQRIKGQLKLDLLIEGCLVVELKAVEVAPNYSSVFDAAPTAQEVGDWGR
ncbi:MAG: GxxExxY protein, partial [Acidobacteriota bacterium]|nr:GxxExxY protein [Acidobacteriota bacterium]